MKIIGTTRSGYYLVEAGEGELRKLNGNRPMKLDLGEEIDVHKIFDTLARLVGNADAVDRFLIMWKEFRAAVWPEPRKACDCYNVVPSPPTTTIRTELGTYWTQCDKCKGERPAATSPALPPPR